MTTTFADYAAAAEARKDIAAAVLGHTYALCEALRKNFIDYSLRLHERAIEKGENVGYHLTEITLLKAGVCDYNFYPETGRKYHKIIMTTENQRSCHAFVDKQTGEVYKSASWKAPAKGVRYDLRLIKDREWLLENATWNGSYLYVR